MLGQAGCNRVARIDRPQAFAFARLTPFKRAGRAHQSLERLGEVAGMQDDEAHAFPDTLGNALDDFILNRTVVLVAPPDQNVGLVQTLLRKAVFRFLKRGGGGADLRVGIQRIGNGVVHTIGVDRTHRLVDVFVDIFAPYNGVDGHFLAPW